MTNAEKNIHLLTEEQLKALKEIPVEQWFVPEESIQNIRRILHLDDVDNDTLTNLRNSVVINLSKDKKSDLVEEEDFKESMDMMTRISMITAVIDSEKIKRGMSV